jgi:hypothetical protein
MNECKRNIKEAVIHIFFLLYYKFIMNNSNVLETPVSVCLALLLADKSLFFFFLS